MTESKYFQATRIRIVLLGVALTLIVVACDMLGALKPLEQWLYDVRVRTCQFFTPKPTAELVHLDIDDVALESIGRWPWKRSELALVIDELRIAGARYIGVDVLFSEVQEAQWRRDAAGEFVRVDHDAILAAAMARHGGVILATEPHLPPIDVLRDAALGVGLAGHRGDEAVARDLALVHDGHAQRTTNLGLLLALHMMQTDASALRVQDHDLILITNQLQLAIPTLPDEPSAAPGARGYGGDAYIPWFGRAGLDTWKTMYDFPAHREASQHYPIVRVHEIALKSRQIRQQTIDALTNLHVTHGGAIFPDETQALIASLQADDGTRFDADDKTMAKLITELKSMAALFTGELSDDEKLMLSDMYVAAAALEALQSITQTRRDLRKVFAGKAVLLGWAATASYDEVPTPLHPKAPGVVVHGAIFNAAMTGEWWSPAPAWLNVLATISIGVLATCAVVALSPIRAAIGSLLLAAGFAAFNGLLLFDYGNRVVALAAPLTAVTAVWAVGTVTLYVLEQLERARITRRFRSYVDPALVDYVLEHPEQKSLSGAERELTVVFTDLAGFTTLSERLKADIVPLLSEYLQRMVPLVRERQGYVNKFLGDGMMFFYGAPLENEGHAIDAVATVLRMQENLAEFNQTLAARGLTPLAMRAGIGSGPMIVGDAGPTEACDYTVIGDTVNLAARLESANKATGTWILINQRARDLVADHFLIRPIANLQVVGKTEGVFVHEPLCLMDHATDEQRELAALTTEMITHFTAARFDECLHTIAQMESRFGKNKLTALYRDHCDRHMAETPDDFHGRIVLTEK